MNYKQKVTLEWLRNVQGFLRSHHISVDGAALEPATKQLDALLEELSKQAVTQGGAHVQARTQSEETRRLRRLLRDRHLRRIVRTARTIQNTQGENTFPTFVMPAKGIDDQRLAAAAAVIADTAEPLADQFMARGLAADFIPRLRAAAAAIVASRVQHSGHLAQRSGATQGVHDRDVRARRVIRLLDALVRPELQDSPELAAAWAAVVRKPFSGKGPTGQGVQQTEGQGTAA